MIVAAMEVPLDQEEGTLMQPTTATRTVRIRTEDPSTAQRSGSAFLETRMLRTCRLAATKVGLMVDSSAREMSSVRTRLFRFGRRAHRIRPLTAMRRGRRRRKSAVAGMIRTGSAAINTILLRHAVTGTIRAPAGITGRVGTKTTDIAHRDLTETTRTGEAARSDPDRRRLTRALIATQILTRMCLRMTNTVTLGTARAAIATKTRNDTTDAAVAITLTPIRTLTTLAGIAPPRPLPNAAHPPLTTMAPTRKSAPPSPPPLTASPSTLARTAARFCPVKARQWLRTSKTASASRVVVRSG